jgi:RES domain-containing protein
MESPLELFVWRLSNYDDLSGRGGLIAAGRWHSRGQCIVYCSETIECAREEVRSHLGVPDILIPSTYKILKIHVPKLVEILEVPVSELLQDWRESYGITQPIGDEWLFSIRSAILKVPSAICAGVSNFLINPSHEMSDLVKIVSIVRIGDLQQRPAP